MKLVAAMALLAAGVAVLPGAPPAAGTEPRIVYRTVWWKHPRRPPHLYVVYASSRGRRLLAVAADQPAWSPVGKRIAFERGGQVLTMSAAGGGLRYATRAAWGTNGDPDW